MFQYRWNMKIFKFILALFFLTIILTTRVTSDYSFTNDEKDSGRIKDYTAIICLLEALILYILDH
ncbi:MAG: hypothetical protein MR750_01795 [Methanobrevibacter boviskoreani]|uniref:hypothetical protein n=1 Tax=Methanobrevibacter boviskoreani TaxID=1348249 RepID=UPI0005930CF9|nr:hypothetical protein [Methanobrevibacter boviskoreani]MCI6929977.1 hypothetical protein [Methanobrevibacter boviskoreani]